MKTQFDGQYRYIPYKDKFIPLDRESCKGYADGSETPNHVICIGDFTTGTVEGHEDSASLYYKDFHFERKYEMKASGDLGAAGRTFLSEVVVILPADAYGPEILTQLLNGAPIAELTIKKLSNTGEANQVTSTHTFKNNFVTYFTEFEELLVIGFRSTGYDYEVAGVDQAAGSAGNAVTGFDMVTSTTA